MAEELTVVVEGRTFTGWENVTIFRTIEACSGSFSLESVDLADDSPILVGNRIQLLIDRVPILTGWVNSTKRTLDKQGGSKITIEGRDLASDLVDCSALLDSGELRDVSLEDLAFLVSEPLGVEVDFAADVDRGELFDLIAVNAGEGAWECLERALRMRGLLAFSQPTGALLITRPALGPDVAVVSEGDNLISGDVSADESNRYRRYVVTGQSRGDDQDWANLVDSQIGSAADDGARPPRTLLIQAEQAASSEDCEKRAQWEATTRAARAVQIGAVVSGWRRPGPTSQVISGRTGPIWGVNERVRFVSPTLRVDTRVLTAACRYRLSKSEGRTTDLAFVDANAFLPQPVVVGLFDGLFADHELLDLQEP